MAMSPLFSILPFRTIKSALIIAMLIGALDFEALAQLDQSLMLEIKNWHQGTTLPLRLLKFPREKFDWLTPTCGMRVFGRSVEDYIFERKNADLLEALIFDGRAQIDSFDAAVSQLIGLKG